jgi:hypothetical protein
MLSGCAAMSAIMEDCPKCYLKDRRVKIAIHLIEVHHMDTQEAMDWLRDQEEKESSRA